MFRRGQKFLPRCNTVLIKIMRAKARANGRRTTYNESYFEDLPEVETPVSPQYGLNFLIGSATASNAEEQMPQFWPSLLSQKYSSVTDVLSPPIGLASTQKSLPAYDPLNLVAATTAVTPLTFAKNNWQSSDLIANEACNQSSMTTFNSHSVPSTARVTGTGVALSSPTLVSGGAQFSVALGCSFPGGTKIAASISFKADPAGRSSDRMFSLGRSCGAFFWGFLSAFCRNPA